VPTRVCLASTTSHYPAQLWPYLNWALSLRAAGCEVIWLESLGSPASDPDVPGGVRALRGLLAEHRLDGALVVVDDHGEDLPVAEPGTVPLEAALDADVMIDLAYLPPELTGRFKRSAFVDLDPGAAQIWVAEGDLDIAGHDVYVSIGEGVEARDRPFPDAGYRWHFVPTPVALDAWPAAPEGPAPSAEAPYTTISHWWDSDDLPIAGEWVDNSKRAGFEPFLSLPQLTSARLELALGGLEDDDEQRRLEQLGWSVRDAAEIVPTPDAYRAYVYGSRGELTAAKAAYSLLQSGWLNDRSASYLAAGRPAIVQRTLRREASRLPDGEGLLRFDTVQEAAAALAEVESDYDRHADAARRIAEEHFDGRRIAARVLELALG
jgi:hypothetical protein